MICNTIRSKSAKNTISTVILFFSLFLANQSLAQTIATSRITNWSHAGLPDSVAAYGNVKDIMNYGGVNNGSASNNTAFTTAVAALGGAPGTIYFPPGTYLFNQSITLRDSLVLKGADTNSRLLFNMNGNIQNMINVKGTIDTLTRSISPVNKNDTTFQLSNTSNLSAGDWLQLYGNDTALVSSAFAYSTVGEIFRVKAIQGNTITIDRLFRRNYDATFAPKIKRIRPIRGVGIQCLYMERQDSTLGQTSNIYFEEAVNCWVIGVESYRTNFAHINITSSANILVRGNYIHHSQNYGSNGQGYGALLQYTSGDCLVENNVFVHLRHSMILQAGANGNVFSYNYSTDPFWTDPSLPANSAGDGVCHGNYPFVNLYEGNIQQNIVIDNSHGINGPYNTFFRNRAQLYGIFQNTGPATDSMNYIGNEVTNTGAIMGLYVLAGVGHFQFGNNIKGTITPAGTTNLPEKSLYLSQPPAYWFSDSTWPVIGTPNPYDKGTNPALARYASAKFTDCTPNPVYHPVSVSGSPKQTTTFYAYPNPAKDNMFFEYSLPAGSNSAMLTITDLTGKKVTDLFIKQNNGKILWPCGDLQPGIYFYTLNIGSTSVKTGKIVLTR